jgi:hypothetical protein
MKSSSIVSFLSFVALPVSATLVTFDSAPYPVSGSPINAPIDGWTTSEPNFSDGGGDFPLFYTSAGSGANTTTFASIGGIYSTPDTPPFFASRSFSVAPTLGTTNFSFEMNLADSFNDLDQGYDGTGIRNNFGFSITTGPTSLIQVSFIPENQGGPENSQNWAVVYTLGGGAPIATGFAIQPGSLTDMRIAFSSSGLEFLLGASSGLGPQPSFTGTPVGYDPSSVSDITASFSFSQGDGTEYSNNTFSFDNIEVVPEPSSLMLLGLSFLGLLCRRR